MIISLIIPIIIILLIVLVTAGIKVESQTGGDQMIKNVFIYLVLFATLMMTIGGSIGAFMSIADIVVPAPYHQSFEEFKRWGMEKPNPVLETTPKSTLSEKDLKEQYDAMVLTETERQIARAKNSLIKSFGWIAIPLPVFLFFQRRLVKNNS